MKLLSGILALFLFAFLLGGCGSDTIHDGDWKIKDPVRYKYEYKGIGGYEFGPTLTVGSNGVMLSVQVAGSDTSGQSLIGKDFDAKIKAGNSTLKQLDKPQPGELMTTMNIPIAIWYFEPPVSGENITKIELFYRNGTVAWDFFQGKKLD